MSILEGDARFVEPVSNHSEDLSIRLVRIVKARGADKQMSVSAVASRHSTYSMKTTGRSYSGCLYLTG